MGEAFEPTLEEARALQERLAGQVRHDDDFAGPRHVAGLDVLFEGGWARAGAAVLTYPGLELVEEVVERTEVGFPYIPGLFSFREVPALLAVIERVQTEVDVWICDGHGVAHPRRFGLASHLGVQLDVPTIGCAKNRLCGSHVDPPDPKGAWSPLEDQGEVVGAVVRTRDRVKPVYVSTGHRISLRSAIEVVTGCARMRIPEPIRHADRLSRGR